MRWKASTNITNTPYIFDKYNNRQYWLDNEAYIVASIMNNYEERIEKLESYIESKKWVDIPTKFDDIINKVTNKFKIKFREVSNRKLLKKGDGWAIRTIEEFDGNKYEVTLKLMEVD